MSTITKRQSSVNSREWRKLSDNGTNSRRYDNRLREEKLKDSLKRLPNKRNIAKRKIRKARLALIIPAHNEEMVIAKTIQAAIAAKQPKKHIFVVSDASTDNTVKIAEKLLGKSHVVSVEHSGKAMAIRKGITHFNLVERYTWIHIADADGGFGDNYFSILRTKLRVRYAAATGYISSQKGAIPGQFRVYEYTWAMEVIRRFQSITRTISVIPGPSSIFRSDVVDKLDFDTKTLTEDFDLTLQLHRKKLGPIQYISEAKALTQDPINFKDYVKQITRWNRGVFQSVARQKIGRRARKIDAYVTYQILSSFVFFFSFFVFIPYLTYNTQNPALIAWTFLMDVALQVLLTIGTAAKAHRWDIMLAFPHIYLYRFVLLFVFLKSWFEVMVLRRHRVQTVHGWSHVERYQAS